MNSNRKNRKLVVIDGNSLINRAYYAIQRPMITKDGLYTQAVYGFLNILQKIRRDYEPGYMVVAFDMKGPTFRHDEYADYKAGRKKMPPELAMQIPVLKEVLGSMNVRILETEGFEADDIIGTVARKAEEEGLEPFIITGDKDALQLASHKTKVIITRRGISQFEAYDHDAMVEKYGFTPDEYVDYKGLMGDASNNIPGIPGVGEKTAQKLVIEYGTIANLMGSLDEMHNKKLRQRIEENIQIALMSRRLAEINRNVPIEISLEDYIEEEPDYNKLIELYKKLEFNSFLRKLRIPEGETKPDEDSEVNLDEEFNPVLIIVKEIKEFADVVKSINGKEVILKTYSDSNHKNVPGLVAVALSTKEKCFYIDCSTEELAEGLKSTILATKPKFVGHGLQKDYYSLLNNGLREWEPETAFDTEIAQYLLQPGRRGYDFSTLVLEYFHQDLSSEAETDTPQENGEQLGFLEESKVDYSDSALQWCTALFKLRLHQQVRLKKEGLIKVFENIELPLISVLAHMETQGISVNREELLNAGNELTEQIESISSEIIRHAGRDFNINSPKQLGEVLFEDLGLPVGRKTKTGYSTNAEVLEGLIGKHEIIEQILEYRTLAKLNGTYVEGLLPLIHADGKIHAHFQQTVVATGRISCTEPNLQNIPIKQEIGRRLRKVFVPENKDWVLVGADYSQIELRVLAHLSDDPALVEAFKEGADIHRATASKVFGVPESEVTPLQRSNAKAVNFGVIYGMSGFGLATELNISRKMAESYIKEYFSKYSRVREYMERQVEECRLNGYVTTIMNRKRSIPEINASNYMQRQAGERLAMNSPIQGSAADIIKIAMIRCHRQLLKEGLKSRLILQVHDELIIQAHRSELEKVETILRNTMENAMELKVPLSVELNIGDNWYELK
ncbi:MAG TPA: DNA polymerase I [Anaerovoracaceae bacterium]|nr:DNA polymerase I [Anaerovoracaceae bacterium]